jgi:hypothetical protein
MDERGRVGVTVHNTLLGAIQRLNPISNQLANRVVATRPGVGVVGMEAFDTRR